MSKPTILFRADGNSKIGLGHIVRSLALAEMLQPHFNCIVAVREPTGPIYRLIKENGCEVLALPASIDLLSEAKQLIQQLNEKIQGVVLDGYQFTTKYQQTLKSAFKLVCIDDIHSIHFVADAIINPAGGVAANNYSKEADTQLFSGPAYALLRSPFLMAAAQDRSFPNGQRVFLNMGGADPENYTARLLEQLIDFPEISEIAVIVGSANPHLSDLETIQVKYKQVEIYSNLSARQMCSLMQSCSLAILPPSSVAYEWCSVGGPLFLIRTADNQINLEQFLLKNKLAYSFADFDQILPELTASKTTEFDALLQRQCTYFDGQSSGRLRNIFYRLIFPDLLKLRRVQAEDLMLLFDWINDPIVRSFSLNPAPVPLTMHQNWLAAKLTDKNCFIFIAEILAEPVGMIRFDISKNEAVISYLMDTKFRGKGLGTLLLKKGMENFRMASDQNSIISGLVQKHNIASIKAFKKAGFSISPVVNSSHPAILKFILPA